MAKLKLSPPWVIFYQEVKQLFKKDPDVHVVFDEETPVLSLYVDDADKADALDQLLPKEKDFGGVTLLVKVIPANKKDLDFNPDNLYDRAFKENPILSYIKTVRGIFANNMTYVVFEPEIVQFFNDDLGDVNGYCSTLYQNIAKDVFTEHEGVFFCTDLFYYDAKNGGRGLGEPLGEWP